MYQNLIGQISGPQISPPSKGELCRASVQIYTKTGIGHAEGTLASYAGMPSWVLPHNFRENSERLEGFHT